MQTEINNKLDALVADGTLSELIAPYVASGLPAVVADQIGAVVAAQIGDVVAAQISAVVADQLPAVVATETAGQAAAWLETHVDPDTGYVIDDTLTITDAAADAKATGDALTELNNALTYVNEHSIVRPKNLYNTEDSDYMAGYRASQSTGLPMQDSDWNLTGFIPLKALQESIVCSRGTTVANMVNSTALTRIYAYGEDKTTFLGATYNTGIEYYTAPQGCAFVRCAVSSNAAFTQHQIEYGTQMTTYVPSFNPYGFADMDVVTKDSIKNISDILIKPSVLPSVIYGFVGVPIEIYPYNVFQYSMDDVYVIYTTSNKGKNYGNRWKYTPSVAENFSFKAWVFDHSLRKLNEDTKQVQIKSSSVKSSLKVLVIGDSTVQNGTETAKMLQLASNDSYDLTLLGTRGTAPNLNEGRGGWTATMYAHNASNPSGTVTNAFYNPATQEFDFSYYMTQQSYSGVDCVFIQLGINDLFSAKTDYACGLAIDTYLGDLDLIVSSIHDYDANIKIVINTIFPSDTNEETFGETYGVTQTVWRFRQNVYQGNKALLEHYANASNVYVSWFGASINVASNMGGDVHPNADGYNQLGTQMYSVMRALN